MLLSAKNVADSRTKRVGFKVLKRFLFHLEAYNPAVKQLNPVVTAFGSDLQLLLTGGNTLSLAPMAMQCEDWSGACSKDQPNELSADAFHGECMKYFMFLCYFTGFLASLAVGRFLWIRHLNRRFRGSRDNFDGIGLEETDASGGWMECHHAAYQLHGDPMVVDDQPSLDLENEEESHETMDETATSPPDSSDLDVPHHLRLATRYPLVNNEMPHSPASLLVWLTERIDNRVLRGTYSQSQADAKKGPLSQFLGDCLIHQRQNDQQILMDLVKQLPDLTDDESSPIHQLTHNQLELEFRQAHQAVQVGSNLITSIAMAAETGAAPTTASAVVNAVANAMIPNADNEISLHMRAMNEPTE